MMLMIIELDMNRISKYTLEDSIERIDRILKRYHIKWLFANHYIAENNYDERYQFYRGMRALQQTDWLKDGLIVSIGYETLNLQVSQIKTDKMKTPKYEKMNLYKRYTEETGKYVNKIIVDENNNLRDGYTTFLIKSKNEKNLKCYLIPQKYKVGKVIKGQHYKLINDEFIPSGKIYTWKYELKDPVIPGENLVVKTARGNKLIKVVSVDFETGKYLDELSNVIRKEHKEISKWESKALEEEIAQYLRITYVSHYQGIADTNIVKDICDKYGLEKSKAEIIERKAVIKLRKKIYDTISSYDDDYDRERISKEEIAKKISKYFKIEKESAIDYVSRHQMDRIDDISGGVFCAAPTHTNRGGHEENWRRN